MVNITREMAKSRLDNAVQDKQFWCQDGRVIKSLAELELALKNMSDETFQYHSTKARPDFSNWVRDVFGDDKLSRDLLNSDTRTKAAKSAADRISWLKNKAR